MSDLGQCQRILWRTNSHVVRERQCSRKAVVERNGKCFCKQHDPENIQKHKEYRENAWRERFRAMIAAEDRRKAEAAACAGVDHLTPGMVKEMLEALKAVKATWDMYLDRPAAYPAYLRVVDVLSKAEGQG